MAFNPNEIWECDLVVEQSKAACHGAAAVAFEAAREIVDLCPAMFWDDCESPIEAVFLIWWAAIAKMLIHSNYREEWNVEPQVQVAIDDRAYRVDLEVVPSDNKRFDRLRCQGYVRPRLAIELDGHDFHERTREQVIYRNARDRALQQANWRVLHFSGSELVRNPQQVIRDVLDACHQIDDEAEKCYVTGAIGPANEK